MADIELPYTLMVDKWETPASKYPLKTVGSAEIFRKKYRRNSYYYMEGVNGYAFYKVVNPIEVTHLKINGKVVMLDDPKHWWGMKLLGEHSEGKVLCGGLGLGLIVHALLENEKVTKIDVAEINPDVIELVGPLLPSIEGVRIMQTDVYDVDAKDYDTIILDLWSWTKPKPEHASSIARAVVYFKIQNPNAAVFAWGHGNWVFNPTFNHEVRRKFLQAVRP